MTLELFKHGLLENDNQLDISLAEADICQSAKLRYLFSILILKCDVGNPSVLWN